MKKHFKLPEPFLTDWKKSLRSGNYRQGNGKLLTTEEYENHDSDDEENGLNEIGLTEDSVCLYCCLGVAGELVGFNKDDMFTQELFDTNLMVKDEEMNKLPKELIVGDDPKNELVNILSSLNDGIALSFIEEKKKLFPGLIFPVKMESYVTYTFEQIADWLDLNVEGYEVSEEA